MTAVEPVGFSSGGPPRGPSPGPHGGDAAAVARALGLDAHQVLDLSASLNPFAPEVSALLPELDRSCVHAYPDPAPATAALADVLDVPPERLLLTNGGSEAIALLAAAHPVGLVVEPAFSLYRRHLAVADDPAGLTWRANPSSPLGQLAEEDGVADVWDEAFWPLATGTWTRGDVDCWRIGSLTKVWACPGVRLGYVVAPEPEALRSLAARQPRWSVNGVALGLVEPLLARTTLEAWRDAIASRRAELAAVWRGRGFAVREASANWILVDDAAAVRLPLARQGILVRDCASFGLLETIRVAVPDGSGIERVAEALDRVDARRS